ncbi:MAG: DNA gyrase subunit B [Planctomycetia bacterium]|nr:DNA gyrase subunit B [Planctomycetia bacterium]
MAEVPPVSNGQVYDESNIQVLKNAAHIRQNPGMYIGASSEAGMHHLFYEVIHNSIDEAMAGYCKNISVSIHVDGSISIEDDGRGIPVNIHPEYNRPTLELVMCEVGAGGKFNKDSYKISGGLHGMGIKAVNALSEWTTVQVRRNDKLYQQDYERGVPSTPIQELGATQGTGTKITFRPDPEPPFFPNCEFNYDTIESRLRELAFLNPGLCIKLKDERVEGREESFLYEGGIVDYLAWMNRTDDALHPAVYVNDSRDGVDVQAALQYITAEAERIRGYSNNIHNSGGGTHVSGLRTALTRTIGNYASKQGMVKESMNLQGDDFREGLTAIINLRAPHPQYNNQAKEKLTTAEIEGIVASVVGEKLGRFLEENPAIAKKIVQKVILAAEAREAAAKARQLVRKTKNILNSGGLPGKLMDCRSKNRDECEIFLVEGDSAGGSADGGRDSYYQAVLPLRGKILNVEKARIDKMLANEEICNIIAAVGTDIGQAEDTSKRNYGKIILLTDADVDGSHIRTLILTFLYRQMPLMVSEGHIYLAQPPLYRVIQKKQTRYVQTKEMMDRELLDRGVNGTSLKIENSKSLAGEQLKPLLSVLHALETPVNTLERKGVTLPQLLKHAQQGVLPSCRVFFGGKESWFKTLPEAEAYIQAETAAKPDLPAAELQELHEVKALMRHAEKLKDFGLGIDCLITPPAVAGVEPPPRYSLENGDITRSLTDLRFMPEQIRLFGEKGMSITRFKGLGEMNPEELWDTTLDPEKRTLLKVKLEDAIKADEMFRILMGDKVEPRREFIERHALEVRNLDV